MEFFTNLEIQNVGENRTQLLTQSRILNPESPISFFLAVPFDREAG